MASHQANRKGVFLIIRADAMVCPYIVGFRKAGHGSRYSLFHLGELGLHISGEVLADGVVDVHGVS